MAEPLEPELAPTKVSLGFVYPNMRVSAFDDCREAMLAFDRANLRVFDHSHGRMSARVGTDGLIAARNDVVSAFLDSESQWLLWVDSDMGFEPDAAYRLLANADEKDRPIVGGLCFVNREFAHDGMFGFRTRALPTIYDYRTDDKGVLRFISAPLYPVNGMVTCRATGSAFVLIHRSVFERIRDANIGAWYDRVPANDGRMLGEDVSFCVRAGKLGIPIHVHTGVRTTHYKHIWLGETDYWRSVNPPPATDEVAVIVPVLRRPQNAALFMRSLRASTGLATCYAIADADDVDTIDAWSDAGAEVIIGDAVTFARKVNLGYSKTTEPWLFLTGDDVKFHPGWLDHAQHVASILEANVVGTNDLGNPRVMAGEHATHLLVRRSYVDEVGASWDGPGVVTHEGYRHWFPDDEVVLAARQRGVWQMALGSIVEHMHPIWGKAEMDQVYELGQSYAEADKALFQQRLAANT